MKNRNTVTKKQIGEIIERTEFKTQTVYGKTTIVSAKLPNGFVIVEASSCVDPANYDEELGASICKGRIIEKIWELEGYKLQDELYRKSKEIPLEEITIGELMELGCRVQTDFTLSPHERAFTKIFISDGRGE